MRSMEREPTSFAEFWPHYVGEHRRPVRVAHRRALDPQQRVGQATRVVELEPER